MEGSGIQSSRYLNPWKLHLQKMELELKCPLCLNLMNQPILLPCDHIFCRSCIQSSSKLESNCPVCKLPYVGSDLRKASYMENIVNIYKGMEAVIATNYFQGPFQPDLQGGQKNVNTNRKTDLNPAMQPSPASSPSFGENKDSDDDGSDVGQHSGKRLPAEIVVKKEVKNDTSTKCFGRPNPHGERDHVREKKRQKLEFQIESPSNSDSHARSTYLDSENKGTFQSEARPKVSKPLSSAQPSGTSQRLDKNVPVVCAFCQSTRVSEASGPMVHYANGKPVVTDQLALHNVLHVHQKCIEWAPQIYFEGETIMNLEVELERGAKLKCSSCGLKGAALGCYVKTCRKTYHVPCAVQILDCRWDCENYLMLCPSHSSVRFPNERSKSKKCHGSDCSSITLVNGQQFSQLSNNVWEVSSVTTSEWVLCGSALSTAEKNLLAKFAKITGATISTVWEPNVTHVIASTNEKGACSRTLKALMAILNGRWILKIDWIKACMEAMHPVSEEPYEVSLDIYGCRDGPKNGRFRIMDKAPKLFNGLDFYFSGDYGPSYKGSLEDLVLAGGGNVLPKDQFISRGCGVVAGSTRVIVYSVDPPLKNESEDVSLLVKKNADGANALGEQTGSWVVAHTWILESVAACKMQHFSWKP